MASKITSDCLDCLRNRKHRSTTSLAFVRGVPGIHGFPSQRSSNAEIFPPDDFITELQMYMLLQLDPSGPFYLHGLTLIPAWMSNHTSSKVWDEITYPFLNFNGATVEV